MMSNRNEVCFTYCYIAQMFNFGKCAFADGCLKAAFAVYIDVKSQEKLYA